VPPNDPELERFEIFPELIGKGSYSNIWKAQWKDQPCCEIVAKVSKKQANRTKKNFFAELAVLKSLEQPNLLKLYSFRETSQYYYLFLEHHKKPTLNVTALIGANGGTLDIDLIVTIFAQVASAVAFLHSNGFGHRDLKSDNILYNPESKRVTVIDFGFALKSTKLCEDFSASPLYAAPEVLHFKPYNPTATDCWSLGVLLFQMVYGKFPFPAKDLKELTHRVVSDDISFPSEVVMPSSPKYPEIKRTIMYLLEKDPAKRMSSAELARTLPHLMADMSA